MAGGRTAHAAVRSGTTPTRVTGRLFRWIVRPMAAGSPPSRVRQTFSVTIAAGTCPEVTQSSAVEQAAEQRPVEAVHA